MSECRSWREGLAEPDQPTGGQRSLHHQMMSARDPLEKAASDSVEKRALVLSVDHT